MFYCIRSEVIFKTFYRFLADLAIFTCVNRMVTFTKLFVHICKRKYCHHYRKATPGVNEAQRIRITAPRYIRITFSANNGKLFLEVNKHNEIHVQMGAFQCKPVLLQWARSSNCANDTNNTSVFIYFPIGIRFCVWMETSNILMFTLV